MSEEQSEPEQSALAVQTKIRHARAEVVADIDRLRHVVRERVSLTYVLHSHPRLIQALMISLGVAGIATFALIWRASRAKSRQRVVG